MARAMARCLANQLTGEFGRYFIVGSIAALADVSTYWAFTELAHIHYLISGILGFMIGLTVNYTLCVRWVFRHRIMSSPFAEFIVFAVIGVLGLGVNELILWIFTDLFAVHYMGSKIVALAVVFMWNFGVRKLVLFRKANGVLTA